MCSKKKFSPPTGITSNSRYLLHVCGRVRNTTSYAVVADTTVHDNKSTALAREVLLAAEIDGSTQRHDPHATMLHLSPCLQFR